MSSIRRERRRGLPMDRVIVGTMHQPMEDAIRRELEAQRFGEAFDLLVEQFKEKVFRLAFSMLRNETQAEDTTQDVFVKIWKNLASYHGGASLSTWIYTI